YDLLIDSVRMRLMSDVPIGAFLSGGMDSSIITALMAELGVSPLRTFTVGFSQKLYDERYSAREISAKFATCHYEKMGNPDDFNLLKSLIAKMGQPYADSSIIPTALVSAFAAKEVKVALGGDGADELFCGYYRYLLMKYASFADILPSFVRRNLFGAVAGIVPVASSERTLAGKLRRILKVFAENPDIRYHRIIVRFDEEIKKSLYGARMRNCEFRSSAEYLRELSYNLKIDNSIERYSALDMDTYLNGDILAKLDIASMASSLEARSPFLDYRVAEFAASLPMRLKQKGSSRKHILRKTFQGVLPEKILNREKKGFGVPLADWFKGSWSRIAEENIIEGRAVKEEFLSRDSVTRMINEHRRGSADHSYALFAILCFALWLDAE
ncbi:MAG TPA: asparagine synthase C-terminal domain-containing protein, partial [Victivallales bacterium]|nr:asparagine synthase C-terminal domain-containing protein [Victivallales bacterium]